MDAPQVQVPGPENPDQNPTQDAITANSLEVEMGGTEDPQTAPEPVNPTATPDDAALANLQEAEELPPPAPKARELSFKDLLASKMVEIAVGEDEHQSVINTHEVLLTASPFLSERVAKLEPTGPRRISLPQENTEAFSCFLEFQYRHDYKIPSETPTPEGAGGSDESGQELLHHARVYTLAEKLGLPELKSLAHKKIHMVGGTPAGELAYARYVYTHTPAEDTTIRKPIASYWASHSHRLRHSVGEEFKKMCIEVPEFTFDMLSIMLDRKEKSRDSEVDSSIRGSARKRLRSER